MAARITKRLSDEWKEKIQVSNLITRLSECAVGNVEMTSQQIKAAEIILKKVIPDLKAIDMNADITGESRLVVQLVRFGDDKPTQ